LAASFYEAEQIRMTLSQTPGQARAGFGPAKIAIIVAEEPTPWLSCRVIGSNLVKMWTSSRTFKTKVFAVPLNKRSFKENILKIQAYRPDQIVLIDHAPQPAEFLAAFFANWTNESIPVVNVHVYGDFVMEAAAWRNVEKTLKGHAVRWLVPSLRHGELLRRLLRKPSSLNVVPFPVDPKMFSHCSAEGQRLRRELKIPRSKTVFVYSGRLSLQKNIALLLKSFLSSRRHRDAILILAGRIDEKGARYFGIRQKLGSYDRQLQTVMSAFEGAADRLRWVDHASTKDVAAICNASDAYISLSTHHDENYGMAPIEALCTGTKAILSRWGGFEGFRLDESVALVPVHLDKSGLFMKSGEIEKTLARVRRESATVRLRRAKFYQSHFSIKAVAATLPAVLASPAQAFAGFSEALPKARTRDSRFVLKAGGDYQKLYGAYFEAP
jgi:glycosyltransferase involved in cell wall biosynthesis